MFDRKRSIVMTNSQTNDNPEVPNHTDKIEEKYIPEFYFTVGKTIIDYTPSGMWGHYVWQSTAPFMCSGIKRESSEHNVYRFTQIGNGSIKLPGDGYNDIEVDSDKINESRISKVDYSAKNYEIRVTQGWIKFRDNYNKSVFKQRVSR
jgi:hypothetical protein